MVELSKLSDYCLSTTHPRGKHKARVFYASLEATVEDAGHNYGLLPLKSQDLMLLRHEPVRVPHKVQIRVRPFLITSEYDGEL
ncbi:hypothetical protein ACFQBQ_17985 [Granulicella cerasi]|uniref:DUF6883 domain-containing protein n=1 Tax=Granulicella cerasi TaxID=741063 RepID=A0ABW1ZDD9_9BACT